ncbi:MAG TPA: hypothetical protein VFQ75_00945 [Candidatus Limnocylindrales bacterium]|nr:hypothetical protein [Candidatus Limnocylindrales bacterium]
MGWPQPQPEEVERILTWLREQDPHLSSGRLRLALTEAGYREPDISAAIALRQQELDAALPPGSDLRNRASAILIVAFLAVWGVISAALVTGDQQGSLGSGGLAAIILGVLLLPVLLLGLAAIRASGRLRRGVTGAMVAILAVPFVILVVVAGTCISTTDPFR